jgi:hypothetical protein
MEHARALRNDNNYKALLIAHEYDHEHMSDLFTQFTHELREGAKRTLGFAAKYFDGYLKANNDVPQGASVFITDYVEKRILSPIFRRYGDRVTAEIRDLLSPLLVDLVRPCSPEADEIHRAVDFAIFDPKAGLMNDFKENVHILRNLIHR